MNNILLFSFLAFFIFHNAQASELIDIDPRRHLFNKEEQFPEKSDIVLKVNFSEPIYEKATCINFFDDTEIPAFVNVLTKNSTFFDIVSDEKCVGTVETDIMQNDLTHVYIRNITVSEEQRGKGIGPKAIDLVVQFYLQKGFKIESFGAVIAEDNAASIRMAEKLGLLNKRKVGLGLLGYCFKVQNSGTNAQDGL